MAAEMFEKLSNLFTSSVTVKAEEDDEEEESEEEEEVTLNKCKVTDNINLVSLHMHGVNCIVAIGPGGPSNRHQGGLRREPLHILQSQAGRV